MPVAIRNLSSRPLTIPLNSGANLRLAPGEVSQKILDVEVKDNSKIDKLLSQRAIDVAGGAASEAKLDVAEAPSPHDESEKPRARKRT